MENVTRGSVYMVTLSDGVDAPVLIVGRNALNQGSEYVLVAPIVERSRVTPTYLPSHVVVSGTSVALDDAWVIVCESIRPINKEHLQRLVGQIPPNLQSKVDSSLQIVLALD
jgi:mRNA-degrading endonuclease toxin of MazEF toxin-antitoxin module